MQEEELIEKILSEYQGEYGERIVKALNFSKKAHEGQKRSSGEEYFTHPCSVAEILIGLGLDSDSIIAAFLHDVLEDTVVTEASILKEFGENVLTLVRGVTKLDKVQFKSQEDAQAENLRRMLLAMSSDIRIIIIKLADRLHNMRTLSYKAEESRKRISKETLEIYAPIAARLGIGQMKGELEDLAFKYLYPDAYFDIVEKVAQTKTERQQFVDIVIKQIIEKLEELGIRGEVNGRPKHFYSIYKKMSRGKSFDQIYDLIAVRIIVDTVKDCYALLGAVHTMWKPLPGRFKDYIAMPKANMYQSLHTTVISNFGSSPFEIQIRTDEMHRVAEYGIAAHWKYKEGKSGQMSIDNKLAWIREVMEVQKDCIDSKEYLDSLKLDLYPDQVFVFTPKGDVINLPDGSTGVDFAYNVHSQVGNKCIGIKINSKIVPLNTTLENGDIVEVITSNASKGPSIDWLKFVKTPSARSKIRQFFKREMKEDNIKKGHEMLEREAKHRGYNLNELIANEDWRKYLVSKYNISNVEEVYAGVGYGAFTTNQVILRLIDYFKRDIEKKKPVLELKTREESVKKNDRHGNSNGILIKGYDDFLIRLSHCCNPVPGDRIIGYISRGRGVSIHRADCPNMKNVEKERIIEAEWPQGINQKFAASLEIFAMNRNGLVLDVSSLIASLNIEMISINARGDGKDKAAITLTVNINNTAELDALTTRLRNLKGIENVFRSANK